MTDSRRLKVSEMDFDQIKDNLKEYLSDQTTLTDYDFEGSALGTLLDVVAYMTHMNAMNANQAINETFLDTAQLRSSVVSHAKLLGYTPRSSFAPVAYIDIVLNDPVNPGPPITMDKDNYVNGSIVVENGKILAVGKGIDLKQYKNAETVDAKGLFVTPGLVDPHCHIGVMEEGIRFEGNDTNEMSGPIYPELRGIDSIYMKDMAFEYTYKAGITTVNTGPGSANVLGGTFLAMKTFGENVDDMVIKEETAMKMALIIQQDRSRSLRLEIISSSQLVPHR